MVDESIIIPVEVPMKYHSPFSTIIISIAVLLVFLAVALLTVAALSMTSPTLILANELMEKLEASDSDISISFGSIDRNLRDGVFISDLSVGYRGEEAASFERLTAHMGLFQLIRFAVLGTGNLSIEAEGGSISITEEMLEGGGGNHEGGLSDLGFLDRYSISFHLHGFDISLPGGLSIDDAEASLYLDHGISGFSGNLMTGGIAYDGEDFSFDLSSLLITASYDSGLALAFSADSASFTSDGIGGEASDVVVRLSLEDDFSIGDLSFSVSSLSGSADDAVFSTGQSSASYSSSGMASIVLTEIGAEYGEYSISASRLDALRTDRAAGDFIISDLSVSSDGNIFFTSPRIEVGGNADERRVSLFAESSEVSMPDSAGGYIGSIVLGSFNGILTENSGIYSFESGASVSTVSDLDVINSSSADLSVSGTFTADGLIDAELHASSVRLPMVSDPFSADLFYRNNEIRVNASFADSLELRGLWGQSKYLYIDMDDLKLSEFRPYAEAFAPILLPYIGERTEVAGTVSLLFAPDSSGVLNGPVSASLILSDLRFNQYSFSLAASLSAELVPGRLSVSSLTITSDFIRAEWNGYVDLGRLLPAGDFSVTLTETGTEVFRGNLSLSETNEYYFSAMIPRFSESWFRGRVDFTVDGLVRSAATFRSGRTEYPFDLTVDLINQRITLNNEALDIQVDYGDTIHGIASFRSFALPTPSDDISPCTLSGNIDGSFSFSGQRLSVVTDSFQIVNMRHLPTAPDLSFAASIGNEGMEITDIILAGVETEPLRGSVSISFADPSFALYLSSSRSTGREEILASVTSGEGIYAGILEMRSFNLARIGLPGFTGSISLSGRGQNLEDIVFAGSVDAESYDMANDPRTLKASLRIDSRSLGLDDIEYSNGLLSISSESLEFSSETGLFSTETEVSYALRNEDRDYPVSAAFSLSGYFAEGPNIAEALIAFRDGGESYADIVLSYLDLDNRIRTGKRDAHIEYSSGRLDISGSLADGYIDIPGQSFSISADLAPAAVFSVSGKLGEDASVSADIESFEVSIANLFMNEPSVIFYDPAPVRGYIDAVKDGSDWDLTGFLEADSAAFDVFWMPGERVILHNPTFTIWDNLIQSNVDDCTVLDLETLERIPGRVSLYLDLSDNLSFEGWGVDVWAYDGKEVGIRLPMPQSNVDIFGSVSGHLVIQSDGRTVYLGGDLTADDLTMSLGMAPLPDWWGSDKATRIDFNLLLRENVRFVFPMGPDPILTATLAENQHLHVIIDEFGDMDISGNLEIRSGEFFYFQKNFYITEGSIGFRNRGYGEGGFDPIINLRARLRDFDSEGRQVDIFLILRNSTLDNISPTFESSPSKDINEIMTILGGAILPSTAYGEISVSSVFSLVSASVDILSRMGVIRPVDNGLEQSIRQSLSLDTFSLHTNIVENILYDTVSLVSSNLYEESLSPMARYLDGTTFYLGKYLTPTLYLEGMIHLSAARNHDERKHTFIADDLNIDIEVSLEWETPMCTFQVFTQPVNITFYDIIDSFGFGFSKRIVW